MAHNALYLAMRPRAPYHCLCPRRKPVRGDNPLLPAAVEEVSYVADVVAHGVNSRDAGSMPALRPRRLEILGDDQYLIALEALNLTGDAFAMPARI